MIRFVLALVLIAGCDRLFNFDTVSTARDGGFDTGAIDAPATDAGETCIGGLYFDVCYFAADVTQPLTILPTNTQAIDTTNTNNCTQVRMGSGNMPDICIVLAKGIDIGGTLRAAGSRPLVLASTTTVAITGTVDASSRSGAGLSGPGHNTGPCPTPASLVGEAQGSSKNHGGGGAGGPLAGPGGAGGRGETSITPASAVVDATFVRGGCPGGAGGASPGGVQALGGAGGGAIYIIAASTITVSGKVLAAGEGGTARAGSGPADFPGGGGGGAGGMIALDADVITVTSTANLIASGGGGGGGANGQMSGTAGGDGTFAGGNAGSGGAGTGVAIGGDGGSGSTRGMPAGNPGAAGGTTQGGGGGGGGGAGVVRLHAPHGVSNSATTVSPAPS